MLLDSPVGLVLGIGVALDDLESNRFGLDGDRFGGRRQEVGIQLELDRLELEFLLGLEELDRLAVG